MSPKKVDYPAVKKALWEAWRIFLPSFLTVIYIQFQAGVDLSMWRKWFPALIGAGVLAGLKAILKWAREKYGNGEYDKLIYKLPV